MKCNSKKPASMRRRSQSGITLIMAMIFLLMLSLLGVWSVTNNSLQERMAGNTRNRDLALQAAESALKYAESTLTTWRTTPFDGTVAGYFPYDPLAANDTAYWQDSTRWTGALSVPSGTLNQVSAAPVYVVHKMPNTANPADPSQVNVENYRITAKAVGGSETAVVILQSIVQYTP